MADSTPPLAVTQQKDIRIVEFTNNRILDEANIAEIGQTLGTLIDERTTPKLLLDFAAVDHLSRRHWECSSMPIIRFGRPMGSCG